jgi:hypothetical protein
MARIAITTQRTAASIEKPVLALLSAGVLACFNTYGHAEERAGSHHPGALADVRYAATDIEKAFWACDYAATTRWVDAEEGAMCVANYEELKRSKFSGDFQALLEWWQKNKAAQHRALATRRP